MDLGNQSPSVGQYDGRSVVELLADARAEVRARQASQVREWLIISAWADHHVLDTEDAERWAAEFKRTYEQRLVEILQ